MAQTVSVSGRAARLGCAICSPVPLPQMVGGPKISLSLKKNFSSLGKASTVSPNETHLALYLCGHKSESFRRWIQQIACELGINQSQLEPLFRRPFSSFRSLTVVSFSNGSIINNMDLTFALVSIPNNTEIAKVLTTASPNVMSFNIDVNSIFVEGSQMSSGVSHKISLITASCMLEPLFRRPFPSLRSLTVVSFSNGSIINNMDLTFALVSIPNNTEIAKVLTTASPNVTAFNIDVNSIFVEGSPSTTTTSATTAEATRVKRVTFRSAGETFTSDLLNPSSAVFMERAAVIKSTLEPLYRRPFPSFRSLTVVSFSNGSIINNMDLTFALVSIPNNTEIAKVLTTASPNITAFNIDVNSIFVEGSQISSGVSHKISLITASCMVLSWLLSSQQ
ncbi:unnamed protein product [Menidia menidia]|uniref:(Atlantic silverside) hypothetical protein n=1 Tax=Menidia menidia TaxID=238744 RepID=A0A8S4BDG5_9TELE|nr:unnamed protein product [Menidia menidia]